MKSFGALAAGALLLVPATSLAGGGQVHAASQPSVPVHFRTPSSNIGCAATLPAKGLPASLRCDILSGLRPEPIGRCELDWTGYFLPSSGAARAVCAGDTIYDRRARIVRYGEAWRRGGYVCRSRRTGLHCTNRGGRGFVLSRARSFPF
jgi:hypothetical protein